MRFLFVWTLIFVGSHLIAQDISVEYDKDRDLTKYKSFSLGEGEIITPKDQRVIADNTMHEWVRVALADELKSKGLVMLDSSGDLTVSYIIGSLERSDLKNLGPMGTSPGNTSQQWSRDYQQSSFVIDLNDKSNLLIWRINGITSTSSPSAKSMIAEVVSKGFKKFSLKPKKEKKKRK